MPKDTLVKRISSSFCENFRSFVSTNNAQVRSIHCLSSYKPIKVTQQASKSLLHLAGSKAWKMDQVKPTVRDIVFVSIWLLLLNLWTQSDMAAHGGLYGFLSFVIVGQRIIDAYSHNWGKAPQGESTNEKGEILLPWWACVQFKSSSPRQFPIKTRSRNALHHRKRLDSWSIIMMSPLCAAKENS